MITAEEKPIEEIREMMALYKRVLVLGCGSYVAECEMCVKKHCVYGVHDC